MTPRTIAAPVLAVFALAACGGDDVPSASPVTASASTTDADEAAVMVVSIENSRFSTPDLSVRVGDTIRFEQLDPYAHTVTDASGDPQFDSGELGQGDVFEITFDEPGTYSYFCMIHPTMRGTVTVS